MKLYTIVITGRKERVILRDPSAPSGVKQIEDTSPMRVHYFSEGDALKEAPRLQPTLKKNPDAQVELPCGRKLSLKDWIAEASTRNAPGYMPQHPEKLGLPLGDFPPGYQPESEQKAESKA